jgi:hypothetical protein
VKGVGRGIFSIVPRMGAGFFGVPAYMMKGLYAEAMKSKGANLQNYIIAARISQGYDETSAISDTERADIINRWKCIRLNIKKKKNIGEDQVEALHTLMNERRQKRHERWAKINTHFKHKETPPGRPSLTTVASNDSGYSDLEVTAQHNPDIPVIALQHANTFPRSWPSNSESQLSLEAQQLVAEEAAEQRQMEAAIAASVAEASRGNPEEDEVVANAIRASIAELQKTVPHEGDEEEALQRAITASIAEVGKSGASEEEKKVLEETLRQSLLDTGRRAKHGVDSDDEWNSDETEDDEDFQRMIVESEKLARLHTLPPEYAVAQLNSASGAQEDGVLPGDITAVDEALRKAIEESEKDHEIEKSKSHDLESDEALRKAIEESEKHHQAETSRGTEEVSDEELLKALEESEKAELERMETLEKQRTEEEIVLDFVKKQSLMEEEHKRRMRQGRDTGGEGSGAGPT